MRAVSSSLLCLGLLLAAGPWLMGQPVPERVLVPVTFRTDQDLTVSSMVMELDAVDYERVPFDTFEETAATPRASTFVELVSTVRDGSLEEVFAMSRLAANENPDARRQFITAFQTTFADSWDDLLVVGRYDLSDEFSTFLWQVPSGNGPFVRSFTLGGQGAEFLWADSTQQDIFHRMDTLLMQTEQARLIGQPVPDLREEYRYDERVPGTTIDLRFDGTVTRWEVFAETRPDTDWAAFYSEAFQAFAARDMEAFANSYTGYSRDKFLDWINNMPAEEFEAYHAEMTEGREVRFLLDADPVYVVFYNTPNRLGYDVLLREGNEFQLTSFYIESFIDSLFKDRANFQEPILAQIAARGEDELEFVPVAVLEDEEAPVEEDPVPAEPDEPQNAEEGEDPLPDSEEEEASTQDGDPLLWILVVLLFGVAILILGKFLGKGTKEK